jgi:NADPH:quinone reductase-like Zn-dependent oxidoreductase
VRAAIPSVDGGSIHWRVADIAEPKPGPAQLLVRVKAASINRGESVLLKTKLPAGAGGIDAAGEVIEVGANVSRFKRGDRVAGRCAGGFAELAAMNEFEAIALPRELGYEEAACLPVSFTVAHDALIVNARLAKGETVLITGVSSAVGVAALAIAKFIGATVIGTSRSPEKLAKLKSAGLDLGIHATAPTFSAEVKRATQERGANIAIDTVGAAFFHEILNSLAVDGRYATIGQMSGSPKVELDMDAFAMRRLHLFGVSNRLRTPEQRAQSARRFAEDLMPAIASGMVKPLIDRVFALEEVEAAHRHVYADRQLGKVVIRI